MVYKAGSPCNGCSLNNRKAGTINKNSKPWIMVIQRPLSNFQNRNGKLVLNLKYVKSKAQPKN
jgi:heterodisulfide reductase subunit B